MIYHFREGKIPSYAFYNDEAVACLLCFLSFDINLHVYFGYRSVLTDPEVHQKLHETHAEYQSRYYGYWYKLDLHAINIQVSTLHIHLLYLNWVVSSTLHQFPRVLLAYSKKNVLG